MLRGMRQRRADDCHAFAAVDVSVLMEQRRGWHDMDCIMANDEINAPNEDILLDHMRSPYHKGRLADVSCSQSIRNPACGDWIDLQLLLDAERRVTQAYFEGRGCAVSQAAASILCEQIEGCALAELVTWEPQQMLELLGVPLSPYRRQCGLLAFNALKQMIEA